MALAISRAIRSPKSDHGVAVSAAAWLEVQVEPGQVVEVAVAEEVAAVVSPS